MSIMCRIFGHNYAITSAFGNYAFCTKCGSTLTIKDPYVLSPGERRYMHGTLMEMTDFGLEEVKHDKETTKQTLDDLVNNGGTGDGRGARQGDHTVQSKDPHEQ
tara:strand:- start:5604 stop:5915 length:312 start_codon:yes stop_codon:yes gene_type:complete